MLSRLKIVLFSTFVLVVLLTFVDVVAANKCKKTLRTMFYNRCHVRNKRSDPIVGVFPSETASNNRHLAKRQIMSIREIFVASRVPIYHVPYPTYARREYVPAIPATSDVDAYRVQTPKPASLPKESHSEVGFEMSYEEMIELFDELYERMPRGTKTREELQKEFLPWLEECCKNIELCRIKKDCPYI